MGEKVEEKSLKGRKKGKRRNLGFHYIKHTGELMWKKYNFQEINVYWSYTYSMSDSKTKLWGRPHDNK